MVILEQKLDRLKKQYKNNITNMEHMRKSYEDSVNRELVQMQKEMLEKISSHEDALKAEYDKEFKDYTDRMQRQLHSQIENINGEYASLKSENDKMRSEIEKLESQIISEIAVINKKVDDNKNLKESQARIRMEKVYDDFHNFSVRYPHEFFEPNASDALLMQMEQTKIDFRMGFYEACMANSSVMEFQIAVFEERIKKDFELWSRYFNQLESYTRNVNEFILSCDFRIIQCEYFEKELYASSEKETDTFDFWSENRYSDILSEIDMYKKIIDAVSDSKGETSEEKIVNFLKRTDSERSVSLEELISKTQRLTQIHKNVCDLLVHIHTSFISSYKRAVIISKKIINMLLTERGAQVTEKGFKDSDIRNEYYIIAREAGRQMKISVFPVSPDNVSVVNSIGVYIEHIGSGTTENLRATEESLINSIKSVADDIYISYESNNTFADCEQAIQTIKNVANEKRRKELLQRKRVN